MPPDARLPVPAPLPVLLVAGWLGAGKTTWINHLLRQAAGRRLAVLVNDFGDVDIDAELLASEAGAQEVGIVPLTGGCLCCSFGDDLPGALQALARREPRPDLALVELSGVALPAAVRRSLVLAPDTRAAGTWVLLDAATVCAQARDPYVGDTVCAQLRAADMLLVNKADRVSGEALEAVCGWARAEVPQARVHAGVATTLPVPWAAGQEPTLAADRPEASRTAREPRPRRWSRPAAPVCTSVERAHAVLPAGLDLDALGRALAIAPGVLRAKAMHRDDAGQAWLLQVTPGLHELRALPRADRPAGRLVVVARAGTWTDSQLQACVNRHRMAAGDGVTV